MESIRPVPKSALRRGLVHAGLVTQEPVPDPLTGSHSLRMEITPLGWEWAQENLGGPFADSPATAETLALVLQAIARFLKREHLRASDLFACQANRPLAPRGEEFDGLFEMASDPRLDTPAQMIDAGIVRQLVTLSSGRVDVPIPLRSLRRLLDIRRQELDASLRRLQQEGRIEWTSAPHAHAVSQEDHEAALLDEYGSPVHHVKLARQLEVAY